MNRSALLVLAAIAALVLAGCTTSPPATNATTSTATSTPVTTTSPATGSQTLEYTANQSGSGNDSTYSFTGPSTARPGWTKITLTNKGTEVHQIVLFKLPANRTFAQHVQDMQMMAMDPNATDPHALMTAIGGVTAVSPPPPPGAPVSYATTESSWVRLTPGVYVLECDIPGPAGVHAMHGMTKELTVAGAETGAEPTADLTLTLIDFNFTWSATPTAGHHVIKVTNTGSMPHEGVLVHLAPNATVQDFLAWQENPQGPPPATDSFGPAALAPGQVEYAEADFAAGGNYGQVCFLPDASGAPHFTHGMIGQFHVA